MDFNEYQEKAHETSLKTDIYGSKWLYAVLGLADESGEVCGKVKKLFRDKEGKVTPEFIEDIKKEIGDVLWYMSEVCTNLGIELDE